MAEQTAEQEPTMEEILASIRRIISEDDEAAPADAKAAAPAPAPATKEEPKAKAKPAAAPAPKPAAAKQAPAPAPAPDPLPEPEPEPEEVLELTERVDEPPPRSAPADDDIAFEEPSMAQTAEDLVSEPVANAAAAAFGDLVGQMLVSSRSTEGKTLEDIVRELIRPMLRQWLDENLRAIVEAKVADEVEKIAMRGRR